MLTVNLAIVTACYCTKQTIPKFADTLRPSSVGILAIGFTEDC